MTLPTIIVSAATTATSQTHSAAAGSKASEKRRRKKAKAAALPAALRKSVTGKGAPLVRVRVHWWKGTADTLKPRPATISTIAMIMPGRTSAGTGSSGLISVALKLASWAAMLRPASIPVGFDGAVRRGARNAVEHAHAVEEEGAGEAAQEHVLERALVWRTG